MNQASFDQIILHSPVLSQGVKATLLENFESLSEASKDALIDAVLKYEQDVLEGAESLLGYLNH